MLTRKGKRERESEIARAHVERKESGRGVIQRERENLGPWQSIKRRV